MLGAQGQCSNRRRLANKRRDFEVCVLINAGHLLEVLR